ncbi:MAG: LPXTG cell wall anchor domain-containing protein, partial [Clostridiales bacterium]|nr:LPXTG cell wall anchor domain-containing protein [Clostridiales bacterium]
LESAVEGTFSVTGLDHGTYYLKEIVAPDGYNLLTDAIKVTITPTIAANDANGGVITTLEATVDMNTGDSNIVDVTATDTGLSTISFNVANNSGILLPSTGGMGTTIFYVAGGVLVLLALVLLISRRRMKNEG